MPVTARGGRAALGDEGVSEGPGQPGPERIEMERCIDRKARDNLAAVIEVFLAEDVGAFEFDDRINAVAADTDDETVRAVVQLLWYHYDDIKDHTVALSREEWDYFQRLLLLLRSTSSLQSDRRLRWTERQAIAIIAILAFADSAFLLGFGWQLLLVTIPVGVVSIALWRWSLRESESDDKELLRLTPFASFSELLAVHRTIPGYRKRRYPRSMKTRKIRGPIANAFLTIYWGAMWLMFSPAVLCYQALPKAQRATRVVLG